MLTLASSTQIQRKDRRNSRGFTLLEVLTVLFIVGLAAALVAPNFPVLLDRIVSANQRENVVRALNTLPYQALATNQNYVLLSIGEDLSSSAPGALDELEIFAGTSFRTHDISRATIPLPEGWSLTVSAPIFYRMSGFCSGGSIELNTGISAASYELSAPLCQLDVQ